MNTFTYALSVCQSVSAVALWVGDAIGTALVAPMLEQNRIPERAMLRLVILSWRGGRLARVVKRTDRLSVV